MMSGKKGNFNQMLSDFSTNACDYELVGINNNSHVLLTIISNHYLTISMIL